MHARLPEKQILEQREFKLALANASRHVLLRSKVLEEVISLIRIMLCYEINVNTVLRKSLTETEVYGAWLMNDLQG